MALAEVTAAEDTLLPLGATFAAAELRPRYTITAAGLTRPKRPARP